ncbi:MAG: response regulator [Chloroflexota bacterium]
MRNSSPNTGPLTVPPYERRALILDDNEGNRSLLKIAVQMGKLDVVETSSGIEACNLWQPFKFAFAFLDIELPDISGLEVARQIREADQGIAIVMCSANDDPETINSAVQVGCDLFLIKPFLLDTLTNLVKLMDRAALRALPRVLIVDNTSRHRWEEKPGVDLLST